MNVTACPVPQDALLQRYVGQGATYTDCFRVHLPHDVSFEKFVTAFYTTPLFRAERFILRLVMGKPSTDADVASLAAGQRHTFAAWRVEARDVSQLLLCDVGGHTRSWLRVQPDDTGTVLLFGSAVVTEEARLPLMVRATLGLHVFYSKSLLRAAVRRLRQYA